MNQGRIFALILIASLSVAPIAAAQRAAVPGELDDGMFVDELSRRGMSELMKRLVDRGDIEDPVANARIDIAQYFFKYEEAFAEFLAADDPNVKQAKVDESRAALEAAIKAQADLIAANRDHIQRPIWQTKQAEYVFDHLFVNFGQYAHLFVIYGMPTSKQHDMFNEYVGPTLKGLIDADLRFRVLESELSRDEDVQKELINSGMWSILFEDNWKGLTQYWLSRTAIAAAHLPDDDPYFQNVDKRLNPLQKTDPKEEKLRLMNFVIQKMQPLAEDSGGQDSQRKVAQQMIGEAHLFAGRWDQAIASYTQALSYGEDDYTGFMSWIGTAWARHKKGQSIQRDVDTLQRHNIITGSDIPFVNFKLLLVDMLHRALMERAEDAPGPQQAEAIALAFQPYLVLLNNLRKEENLDEGTVLGYQFYIYERWLAANQGKAVDNLPSVVVMAMGTASRAEGERSLYQSDAATVEKKDAEAAELKNTAMVKLQQAVGYLDPLQYRKDLEGQPEVRARTLYNLGLATYLQDRRDPGAAVTASTSWIDAARDHADLPEGEKSVVAALQALQRFYDQPARPDGVLSAFEEAIGILFEKYPTSDYADDVRFIYAIDILKPEGKIGQAIEVLKPVPRGHPTYFESQRELLYLYYDQFLASAESAERQQYLEELKGAAQRVEQAGLSAASEVSRDALSKFIGNLENPEIKVDTNQIDASIFTAAVGYDAAGHGRIMRATVEAERSNLEDSLDLMDNFEQVFGMSKQLLSFGKAKRISILIKAEKIDEAAQEARDFLDKFPDVAASEINMEIDRLEGQIDMWRKRAEDTRVQRLKDQFNTRATKLAAGASEMAEAVLERAVALNLPEDQVFALELLAVKALRLAGKYNQALTRVNKLQPAHNADVIHNKIELEYAIGVRDKNIENLINAFDLCKAILDEATGLQPDENKKYPPMWWNAWARWAEILDAVSVINPPLAEELVKDIPIRVRALEQTVDRNLGGEPYKSRLKTLAQKYQ